MWTEIKLEKIPGGSGDISDDIYRIRDQRELRHGNERSAICHSGCGFAGVDVKTGNTATLYIRPENVRAYLLRGGELTEELGSMLRISPRITIGTSSIRILRSDNINSREGLIGLRDVSDIVKRGKRLTRQTIFASVIEPSGEEVFKTAVVWSPRNQN